MFLKRLELQGFKSFADKVNLDLSHGVTAVVGPNGSGKSNITDAIRWLLGERDTRNLRGGKLEDLIFAGTKDRPRLGLAQASLIFDNSSGFFPVDYKEVSIGRRVSRDGESQIFLNKSEVRLKDIIDFFARSRMGARGMNIVSQGESDIFINATPFERRQMIEEILGLKEYELKKAEANRRLKNTSFNLEKAKALIDELSPHLKMLKKQIAKYEGRKEVAEELRELEDDFYGGRLKTLKNLLSQIVPIKDLEKEIGYEESVIEKLESELEKVKNSQPVANEKIKSIQAKRKELLDRRFTLEKELSRIEARLELNANPETFELASLISALNDIKSIATDFLKEDEIGRLKDALGKIISLIGNLFGKNNLVSDELSNTKVSLVGELDIIKKELEDIGLRESEFTENIKGFNTNFKEAFMAFEEGRTKLLSLQEKKNAILFERERIEIKMKDLSDQITEMGRNISEFSSAAESLSGQSPTDDETVIKRMFRLRGELSAIGDIDPSVVKDYEEMETRHTFLTNQITDLEKAIVDLKDLIKELDYKIRHEFTSAVDHMNVEFTKYIHLLFGGGTAKLTIEEKNKDNVKEEVVDENGASASDGNGEEELETGVYININLPRKKVKGLEVLSGGERALVSVAALFALISVSPPPFLVLDEIDAALDESNARRFSALLKDFAKKTQFIIVTHNRATMEAANVLYGVTMSGDGTSKVLSLKLG